MGLRFKIIFGSTLLVLFVISSMLIQLTHWREVNSLINHMIHDEQPALISINKLDALIQHATATLNAYLLTAEKTDLDKFIQQREALEQQLQTLNVYPNGIVITKEPLLRLRGSLQRYLDYANQLIELRSNAEENYNAIKYSREHVHPIHLRYLETLNALVTSKKYPQHLERFYSLQQSWMQIGLALRFYISERDPGHLQLVHHHLVVNQQTLSEFPTTSPELLAYLDELSSLLKQRRALITNIERIVEGDGWRQDIYLLNNYLLPVAANLERQVQEIVNHFIQHTKNEGHALLDGSQHHRTTIEFLLLTAIAIGLITGFWIWRWLNPIRDFVTEIRSVDLSQPRPLSSELNLRRDELGELARAFDELMNQLAERINQQQVIENDLRLAAITFQSNDGIVVTDAATTILRVNDSFCRITGYTESDIIGKKPTILSSGVHDKEFYRLMWYDLQQKGYWEGEIWNQKKSGERYPEWLSITSVDGPEGLPVYYVAHFHDLTQKKRSVERLHRRMRLEKAISTVAIRCLQTEHADQERDIIANTVMELGNVLGVDFCYFSGLAGGYEKLGCDIVWSATGDHFAISEIDYTLTHKCPAIIQQMGNGKMVLIENSLSLHDLREKKLLEQHGIRSLAMIPIDDGNGLYGYFAFATTNQQHEWLGGDVQLLTLVAEVFLTTKHRQNIEKLREESEHNAIELLQENRRLVQYNLAFQEIERRKLAQELHDEMGQLVVGINMDAGFIRTISDGQPDLIEVADDIEKLSSELIDLMRLATRRLRTATLDHLGLIPALEETLDDWCSRQPEIECHMHLVGKHEIYHEDINVTFYRVLQESLTNIAKHANADRVDVGLERVFPPQGKGLGSVRLWIEDNGIGFDIKDRDQHGLGIFGMAERVDAINGKFTLYGLSGEGTTTLVEIPLTGNNDS